MVSKVKEPGMTVWTEVMAGAECRITKLLAYDKAKRVCLIFVCRTQSEVQGLMFWWGLACVAMEE